MWGSDFTDLEPDDTDVVLLTDDEPEDVNELRVICDPIRPRAVVQVMLPVKPPTIFFRAIPQAVRLIEEAEVGDVREYKSPTTERGMYVLTPYPLYMPEAVVAWLESFRLEE